MWVSLTNWHGYISDELLNAKFDKDMNSMKLHRPLKIFKLLGKQLVDFEKKIC